MKKSDVIAAVAVMELAVPDAAARLDGGEGSPLVASKGAGSVHVLRRMRGTGWQYIGFAVWSCAKQSWVCGSWRRPTTARAAHQALLDMDWAG